MGKKAQMAVELILITSAVLLMLLSMFYITNYRDDDATNVKRSLDARDEADKIAWQINQIYISGFGSQREINVKNESTDDTDFEIFVLPKNREIKIEWGEHFYTSPLVTSQVYSNISGDTSINATLNQGSLYITNVRGEIHLTQL